MSVTVASLVQLTRRRLHEANNSVVGEMATGTGGSATVSGENGIIEALNRVAEEICRTCFYYEGTGSLSTTTRAVSLASLTMVSPTASSVMWFPIYVATGAGLTPLTYVSRGLLPSGNQLSTATGTPLYWMDGSEGSVEINPAPTASTLVTVRGAAIPAALASGGSAADFLTDALLNRMLPAGAAARLAMAEVDNPALAARGPLWQAEYDEARQKLWRDTPYLIRQRCFPTEPGKF